MLLYCTVRYCGAQDTSLFEDPNPRVGNTIDLDKDPILTIDAFLAPGGENLTDVWCARPC